MPSLPSILQYSLFTYLTLSLDDLPSPSLQIHLIPTTKGVTPALPILLPNAPATAPWQIHQRILSLQPLAPSLRSTEDAQLTIPALDLRLERTVEGSELARDVGLVDCAGRRKEKGDVMAAHVRNGEDFAHCEGGGGGSWKLRVLKVVEGGVR
jgi:hypothetical protein